MQFFIEFVLQNDNINDLENFLYALNCFCRKHPNIKHVAAFSFLVFQIKKL